MADLEFRILGMLEVLLGSEQLRIRQGSTRNLLAGLLVSANSPVDADMLAELTWGERLPRHARAALHNKISRLRQLLGGEVIESVTSGYRLRVGTAQLDLLQFDHLLSAAADTETDEEIAATLAEATGLWRGTPLGGVDAPALAQTATVLTERYLAACETWARASLRLGRHKAVVEKIAPLVAAHPLREPLVAQLMLALHDDGRQAEALTAYEELRRALRDGLGVDPGRALEDLYLRILRGELSGQAIPPPPAKSKAPAWTGRKPVPGGLIGRDADLAALAEATRTGRTVTLVGPAGAGKTALALETAQQITGEFADGVVVIELGLLPAQQSGSITAVAGALLAATESPGTQAEASGQAVSQALQDRQCLIVLDNAEHVSVACAGLVEIIEASCPRARVIVTSRRPLGRGTERVIDLLPLAPSSAAELLRARMASHGVDPGEWADPAAVSELCRLIEGLPLAVELAAARLRTMSLPALLERITGHPDLLTVEGRPGLAHQRGLASTLRWSYDLLIPDRRLLMGRLTAFAGTFSLEAAEEVTGYAPLAVKDIAGLLSGLADESLVQVARGGGDQRYRLLVPVRDFAARNADSHDLAAVYGRHLRLLCQMSERIETSSDRERDPLITRLLERFPEVLRALAWAARSEAADPDIQLAARLLLASRPAWERRPGATPLILQHAVAILSRTAALPEALTADLTLLAGHLYFRAGQVSEAQSFLERAHGLLAGADLESRRKRAEILSFLAAAAHCRLEPGAVDLIRQAADAARETSEPGTIRFRLAVCAVLLAARGNITQALDLISEAGAVAASNPAHQQRYLTRRAEVYLRAHRIPEALADASQVLGSRASATSYDLVSALLSQGIAQHLQGDTNAARAALEEGQTLARQAQATTLLPEFTQALAYIEFTAGNRMQASQLVREVLQFTLPHADLIDTISAAHLAVALATVSGSPGARTLATAVRDCRLRSGLTTWPFTERDYAQYEERLRLAAPPDPGRQLSPDVIAQIGELALSHLLLPACA